MTWQPPVLSARTPNMANQMFPSRHIHTTYVDLQHWYETKKKTRGLSKHHSNVFLGQSSSSMFSVDLEICVPHMMICSIFLYSITSYRVPDHFCHSSWCVCKWPEKHLSFYKGHCWSASTSATPLVGQLILFKGISGHITESGTYTMAILWQCGTIVQETHLAQRDHVNLRGCETAVPHHVSFIKM